MRYLRMLSNSACGGALAAVYLAVLVLHLNPRVPLTPETVVPLAATLVLSYGVHIAALLYAGFVCRQIVALDPVSPGWLSLNLLTWSAAVLSAAAGALAWSNAAAFPTVLHPAALAGLVRAALVFIVAAAAFFVLAVARSGGRAGRAALAAGFVAVAVGAIGGSLLVRGRPPMPETTSHAFEPTDAREEVPQTPRIVMLLLDGASLGVISPAVAEGRLPNFGRLLDGGASMHLASVRPTQPEPAWTSVFTGKWPGKHGIQSAATYRSFAGGPALELLPDYTFAHALVRFGFLAEEARTLGAVRAEPLWRILNSYGLTTGVVGVPLTHPAVPIDGFMVSDRFHHAAEAALELDDLPAVHPPDLAEAAREVLNTWPTAGSLPSVPGRPDLVERAAVLMPHTADGIGTATLLSDRVHHDVAARLAALRPVRVLAVRYQGVDAVGHYYLRYAMPREFGDVPEDERRRFGRVLDDYYEYVDALVGNALASIGGDDLLLVISPFGMEPLSPGKRLLERLAGNEQFSGTHERAPDGFLLAFGSAAARGRVARGALVDVTPTVLYFLGLPVARDMDGFARTDLFTRAFTARRTITFIPTYDR